jgi:hypothetical protein
MPITALAIGAGVGLLKGATVDQAREDRQRKLAGTTQRYSPWTGLAAQPVQEADPLGSAMQFGAAGAQLGSNMDSSKAQQKLMQAQAHWLDAGGNPNYTAAMSTTAAPSYGAYGPKNPWNLGVNYSSLNSMGGF